MAEIEQMAPYMPKPSVAKIRETELQSLGEIVQDAARDVAEFVYLAIWRRDAGEGERVEALTNARLCLDKASSYLALLADVAKQPEK